MTKIFRLFLATAVLALCACSAEVASEVTDEPVDTTTAEVGTNACDPLVTEPYVPQTNWIAFNIFNTGLVSCLAASDVRFSVTWCEIWVSGTTGCSNKASHVGPFTLSPVGQAGYNQNIWLQTVVCNGKVSNPSNPNYLGQRVQATVEWKKNGTQYRRTATHDCL